MQARARASVRIYDKTFFFPCRLLALPFVQRYVCPFYFQMLPVLAIEISAVYRTPGPNGRIHHDGDGLFFTPSGL